ncbi:MAG TPA: c-type cytochrome [Flavitalea sp.]|nr:c-type cytochrome [Flavitalea sp.]
MIGQRRKANRVFLSLLIITAFSFGNKLSAQDGKTLFTINCASCHGVLKKGSGPALTGFETRGPWSDRAKLYDWVHNPAKFMQNDPYTSGLKAQFGIVMTAFPSLTTKEIDAIADYIQSVKPAPAGPTGDPSTPGGEGKYGESDNAILYGVLTLILAVVALIMLQVNSNLRKLADEKDGLRTHEPIPFYRNKTYITLLTLILFVVGGFFVVKGAIGLGRNQKYQPEQPIYFSHKVHPGQNQISCLYCHGPAFEGKQATIPSVNVCMNCHMNIAEYSGPAIYKEDGSEVNGTAEIRKLYDYAGWDPQQGKYVKEGKPIPWVKIHTLPDHVYFNHSQHTKVGQVQCQTCHGEITAMNEVYQASDLSMGWCVNCHRETNVNFVDSTGEKGNKFYSIYEKYHNEIKSKQRDSVTVNEIGGLECQKCHY